MVASHMVREVSPIPPGRYWIIVQGAGEIRDFDAWIRDMRGAVRVETSELDQAGPKPVAFLIFNVPEGRMPFLAAEQFGFPNTAPPEITTRADVEQSPPIITDPVSIATNLADRAGNALATGGSLLVLAVLGALLLAKR